MGFFKSNAKEDIQKKYSLLQLQDFVANTLEHLRKYEVDDKREEYRRRDLIKISKNCGKGDLGAKLFMKNYIMDLICQTYGVNEENVDYIMDFNSPETIMDKFDIVLYMYKKEFKYKALTEIIKKYNLDKFRHIDGELACLINEDDIEKIYVDGNFSLSFEDKLNIIVQNIYQNTKGLGVIDEIRDQFCDGLSLGVSGVPNDFISKLSEMDIRLEKDNFTEYKKSFESIWLYYKGNEMYLSFLSFGSENELERICRLMYRFQDTAQLTRADGFGFNHMADLSRIAVFRPPFSEGWCAFIRKFDVDPDIETLIEGENSEIVKEFLSFAAKGNQKFAVTGPQGTGKTTLLIAIIKKMYPNLTLRVWEDFFESFLRIKMPNRNIMTIKRTSKINGERGLDALKKSNGQVTIIQEVAEDEVIKYIVKIALAASKTIYFTHHANSADDLVSAFVNGAVNTGAFTNEDTAEREVLKALGFNPHLYKSAEGERCIERINEFVVFDDDESNDALLQEVNSVKETATSDQKLDILLTLMGKMFTANKNTKKYKAVEIIRYNFTKKGYEVVNKISEKRKNDIMQNLLREDKEKFQDFIIRMESQIV